MYLWFKIVFVSLSRNLITYCTLLFIYCSLELQPSELVLYVSMCMHIELTADRPRQMSF